MNAVRSSVAVVKKRVVGAVAYPPEEDLLAIEDPLELTLSHVGDNGECESKLGVTMRTPGHDQELIYGFLYCERIIQNVADIQEITFQKTKATAAPNQALIRMHRGAKVAIDSNKRKLTTYSSCGACGTTSIRKLEIASSLRIDDPVTIPSDIVHELPKRMCTAQTTFQKTGGLHACALFSEEGRMQVSREDIGRHNALDKVIGAQLHAGTSGCLGKILCVSGRMSYEILQKALIAQVPIIVGVGAPSSLAVTLANDFNVTLIGFVRGDSYNIYSCPDRIRSTER